MADRGTRAAGAPRDAGRPVQGRPRRRGPAARRRPPRRRDAARHGQRPQPRLPPRPARSRQRRRRQLLELARADVRRRGAAQPRHVLRAGAGRLRRDGAGRHHRRGGVPLRPPPSGRAARTATRTPWVSPCARRPTRPASGSRCSTRATSRAASTAAATSSSTRASAGSATARVDAWAERMSRAPRPRRTGCGSARRSTRSARSSATDLPKVVEAAGDLPLHVHLSRAARREPRLPDVLRREPDPAARRGRRSRRPLDGRARHAPRGPRHRAPRRHGHRRVLLPDDRARPRRRHRPGPRPARRRQPALAGLGPARRHRPVRGAARARDARAARHQRARPLLGRRPAPRGARSTATGPSAGPTGAT